MTLFHRLQRGHLPDFGKQCASPDYNGVSGQSLFKQPKKTRNKTSFPVYVGLLRDQCFLRFYSRLIPVVHLNRRIKNQSQVISLKRTARELQKRCNKQERVRTSHVSLLLHTIDTNPTSPSTSTKAHSHFNSRPLGYRASSCSCSAPRK